MAARFKISAAHRLPGRQTAMTECGPAEALPKIHSKIGRSKKSEARVGFTIRAYLPSVPSTAQGHSRLSLLGNLWAVTPVAFCYKGDNSRRLVFLQELLNCTLANRENLLAREWESLLFGGSLYLAESASYRCHTGGVPRQHKLGQFEAIEEERVFLAHL